MEMEIIGLLGRKKIWWVFSQLSVMCSNVLYVCSTAVMVKYVFLSFENKQSGYIWTALAVFVAGILLACFFHFIGSYTQKRILNTVVLDIKEKIYGHIVGAAGKQEDYLHMMNEDVDNIRDFFMENIIDIVTAIGTTIVSIGMILYVSPFMGITLLGILILSTVNQRFYILRRDVLNAEVMENEKKCYGSVLALMQMQDILRSFNSQDYGTAYFKRYADLSFHTEKKEIASEFKYTIFNGIFEYGATAIPFVLMFLGVLLNQIKLSDGIFVLQLAGNMFFFGNKLVPAILKYSKVRISFHNIEACLGEENPGPQKKGESTVAGELMIKTENLSISYEGRSVISDFSVRIPEKGITLILGESGCGKSSILYALQGICEYEGKIGYFDTQGREWTLEEAKGGFAHIPQRLELFQDTIHQNILYGNLEGTLEDVRNAMGMTGGSSEWVDKLPQKWETVFDGENLSGGEIQKVMIARALMKKRSVIFMDEPTASLDRKAAQFFVEQMKELSRSCSVIIVSHEINLLSYADNFIYIENGAVKYASQGICEDRGKETDGQALLQYFNY